MFEPNAIVTIRLTVTQWNYVLKLLLRYGILGKAGPIHGAITEQAKVQLAAQAVAQAAAARVEPEETPAAVSLTLAPEPRVAEKVVRRVPRTAGNAADQAPAG